MVEQKEEIKCVHLETEDLTFAVDLVKKTVVKC